MNKKLFTNLSEENYFKTTFKWTAPERHWYPKDRFWYVSYALFFIVLVAVFALLEEYLLIIAVMAFIFLWFTQATIPPEIAEHSITSLGVKTFGKLYQWRNIKHYWFTKKNGVYSLNLELLDSEFTTSNRLHRIALIVNEDDLNTIFYALLEFIDYGDQDEIDYNFIMELLHGKHIDISFFLDKTQEEYLEEKPLN